MNTGRRLYRSTDDRKIGGVCAGLANYFGIDPTVVRIVTLLLVLFGGMSLWVYILLWIFVPTQPRAENLESK